MRGPKPDLDGAFQVATKGRTTALITITNATLSHYTSRITDLAIKHRLAAMYEAIRYVEAGGLMSYSANEGENYRRCRGLCGQNSKGRTAS